MEDTKETNNEDTNKSEVQSDGEENNTSIEKVTENYQKLKAENDKVEIELLRAEELKAKIQLGGKSMAGQEPEKPKEETDEEFTARFERGEVQL